MKKRLALIALSVVVFLLGFLAGLGLILCNSDLPLTALSVDMRRGSFRIVWHKLLSP